MKQKKAAPIQVRMGNIEFIKVNADAWEWRDVYHWVLSLRWTQFIFLVIGLYILVNALFATAYYFGGNCIAEVPPNSFPEAFYFSVETFATVGYGHMYPITTYGHIVVSIEIMCGMFWMAVMTGLIFVRFSRPTARILFSHTLALAPFNGKPTLMLRIANGRHQSLVEAHFRMMMHRDEWVAEGEEVRHFHDLKLTFDYMTFFPAAITLRHVLDESSPLYGVTAEEMERSTTRFMVSVSGTDTVIPAPVSSQHDYHWTDVRFGEKFVDVYDIKDGRLYVDYARLHETEAVTPANPVE